VPAFVARTKLVSAQKIAAIDIEVAYVTAYDAARIAITSHMLSLGYRVRAAPRAHEAVGAYAEAMINTPSASEFQRMVDVATKPSMTTWSSASLTSQPISAMLKRSSTPSVPHYGLVASGELDLRQSANSPQEVRKPPSLIIVDQRQPTCTQPSKFGA
jgi:hypothetical protein